MKYFWATLVVTLGIIVGSNYVDYKTIISNVMNVPGEGDQKEERAKKNNKIAYSLLEAISKAESSFHKYTKEAIRYIVKNGDGEITIKRHMFTKSDYDITMVMKKKRIVLKVDSFRKFYYKLDNLLVRDLPVSMQDNIHSKLEERYLGSKKKLIEMRKEISKKQELLITQKKQKKTLEMQTAELEEKKQTLKILTQKKEREQKKKATLLKKREQLLEKKKKELSLREKRKKDFLKKKRILLEKEKKDLDKKKKIALLKKKKAFLEKQRIKNKNVVSHEFIPLGNGYHWTYRVIKYLDKTISNVTFTSQKQNNIWIWEDNKGNVKNIFMKNGFVFIGRKKWLPCSLSTKKWRQGGYDVSISHDGERISTDAGTFSCMVVIAKSQENPYNIVKEYYTPFVGKIKQERYLNGRKIYEKVLIDYQTSQQKATTIQSEKLSLNMRFFPINKKTSWDYTALKLLENTVSSISVHHKKIRNKWKLRDGTGYTPSIAVSENFIIVGLEKLLPIKVKKSQAWRRGKFQVHVSHFGEIVNTGMGNFKCLLIIAVHTEKPNYIVKEYYAPGVGEVKKEIFSKNKKIYERILKRHY